jgi:hypothetical protein
MIRLLTFSLLLVAFAAFAQDDPWADAVLSYSPVSPISGYDVPARILGAPLGGGPTVPNNDAVVTLGNPSGRIVVSFHTPVEDDPLNPMGLDCIVYCNGFWVGGDPQRKWQEPAIIEISRDANNNGLADETWYLIPGSRNFAPMPFPVVIEPPGYDNLPPQSPTLLAGMVRNANFTDANPFNDSLEYNWGYAEMTPAALPYLDNYMRPDDPFSVGITSRSGGGDAFDIAWAVDSTGAPANISEFHFLRLTSLVSRNLAGLGTASPEIDAVADVAPNVDTDNDGILDDYEIRVSDTDPLRPESTVLPLEIPALEGGSPAGTLLGSVEDATGTRLRLFSAGPRTATSRRYNLIVDLLAPTDPGGPLPVGGLIKSGSVRQIISSENDFLAANIQAAHITITYTAGEIAGLEETALQPFRWNAGAYTADGITTVSRNATANQVSFDTRYPGTFILASIAGSGDTGGAGPTGIVSLTATPTNSTPVGPSNQVVITSGTILNESSAPVPDGTLITIAASRGTILTPDANAGIPGIQVLTASAAITFTVQAPTQSGTAFFTAASVQGTASGEIPYRFLAGPPSQSITWSVGEPIGTSPVSVILTSSLVRDTYGNVVEEGTPLTVSISGAVLLTPDAAPSTPGHQVFASDGRAQLLVEVTNIDDQFTLDTFADAAQTQSLGSATLSPNDYVPLPVSKRWVWIALLAGYALLATRSYRVKTT